MKLGNTRFYCFTLLLAFVSLGVTAFAQEVKTKSDGFCRNNNYSNSEKSSFNEVREVTMPAGSLLTVDGQRNGGIWVKGANRSDVLVRACIQARAGTDEAARALANSVRIETGSVVRAEAASEENLSVSYEIHVPRNTNLKLTAKNGGIGIRGVEGNMEFETVNGGLHLGDIAGDVRGRTANGGLHVELSGNGWKGSGLDVQTTNGGVHLSIPETFAANIETGTVNGGWHSNFAELQVERTESNRYRPGGRLNKALNGGGAPVRLITTNGGVHINSTGKSKSY
ncbi:MAG TPA: hypothetical protein VF644_18340 [Pyrinomonadaceae bacterium]|jgi:hypothetical protein